MSSFYIVCLLIVLIIVMVSIITTRGKTTKIQKEVPKEPIDEQPDGFDLYDSVYELLAKQKRYLLTLK